MDLHALAGNGPLKRQLDLQTARRGLSHAYILSGPAGSGKRTLAALLSAALVCSGPAEQAPCLHCSGCRKAMGGIHPDIVRAGAEGDINVAQIRALRADAYIRPNEAARKVYLLERAHTMNPSAQNAMLKLLEEGPPYAAFLLLTENAAALLPTVRSRCETLTLSPVSLPEAEAFLYARYPQRSREELSAAARRCEGLLGRAVAELEGTAAVDSRLRDTALLLAQRLSAGDELALAELCISLEKWERDDLAALMGETVLLLRDALVQRAGAGQEEDPQRRAAAASLASALSSRAMLEAIRVLEELRTACGFYVGAGHLAGWLCARLASIQTAQITR